MCNFVIRPITSLATVDVGAVIKAGDKVTVKNVSLDGGVEVDKDGETVIVPLNVFVHTFTANPDDIEKVRKVEHKTLGYEPNKKKEEKKDAKS